MTISYHIYYYDTSCSLNCVFCLALLLGMFTTVVLPCKFYGHRSYIIRAIILLFIVLATSEVCIRRRKIVEKNVMQRGAQGRTETGLSALPALCSLLRLAATKQSHAMSAGFAIRRLR